MMQAAAHALANRQNPEGRLLPPLQNLRSVAVEIALAVGLEAQRIGLAPLTTSESLREEIDRMYWTPHYPDL